MKAEFYINFKAKKKYGHLELSGAPKTSIKKPTTTAEEVCVKMELDIPDALFQKPILSITGKIDYDISKESQVILATKAKSLIEKSLNIRCEIKE